MTEPVTSVLSAPGSYNQANKCVALGATVPLLSAPSRASTCLRHSARFLLNIYLQLRPLAESRWAGEDRRRYPHFCHTVCGHENQNWDSGPLCTESFCTPSSGHVCSHLCVHGRPLRGHGVGTHTGVFRIPPGGARRAL